MHGFHGSMRGFHGSKSTEFLWFYPSDPCKSVLALELLLVTKGQ